MPASTSGVRLVRCPKCRNVLAEITNFPVYQCGGCGTILRAKHYDASRGNSTTESLETSISLQKKESLETNFQDAPSRSSSDNELAREMPPNMTEVDNAAEKAVTDNQNTSQSYSAEQVAWSEHGEHTSNALSADIDTPIPTKHSSVAEGEKHATFQDSIARKLQGEDCVPLNALENFAKLPEQGHGSFKLNEKTEDNTGLAMPNTTSEEDADDRHDGRIDSLNSSTRRSQSYGHGLSSFNAGGNTLSSDEMLLLKEKQFRSEASQDIVEMLPNPGGENISSVDKMTAEAKNELPADNLSTNLSNQGYTSDTLGRIHANVTDKSVKKKFHVGRDTSLDSADFHSVQNQFDSEKYTSFRHISMDDVYDGDSLEHQNESTSAKLRTLENVQLQILKKVDDLIDEIGSLYCRPVQVNGRSQLGGIDEHSYSKRFQSKSVSQYPKANEPSFAPPSPYETQTHGFELEIAEIREKKKPIKHHCRPVLGGAPFVICHNCLKLLQLPLDFLVTRKRFYRLQCGSCSKVLKFSFRSGKRDVPLTPDSDVYTDVQHPPSQASTSQLTDKHKEDHASDYQLSFAIRYPINIEQHLHDPGASADSLAERNIKFRKSSKLHRLMGYGSASELLFHHSDTDGGFENTGPSTPHSTCASESGFARDVSKGKALHISSGSNSGSSPDSIEMYHEYSIHAGLITRRRVPPLHQLQQT